MNNNRGMALVVALLTSFILLALVASLFWVIAATSRQSEYAKNSAIALNLAEAGTADAIYRLNYENTPDYYPFSGTLNPFETSELITLPTDIFPISEFLSTGIMGSLPEIGGVYYVGIQDNSYPDTLVAVGIHKGIRRILVTSLRGNNSTTNIRQGPTQGISEAFNKHAVYCNLFTANGATINGNIVYFNNASTFPTTGNWTKTKISTTEPPIPNRAYFESIGDEPPPQAIMYTYDDPSGGSGPYPQYHDPDGPGPLPEAEIWNGPVFWFQTGDVISFHVQINGDAQFRDNSSIQAYTQVIGNVELRDQATVNNFLNAAGTVNISGTPTIESGNNVCVKGNNVNLTGLGITINGGLIKANNTIWINQAGENTNPYLANFFAEGPVIMDNTLDNGCVIGDANHDVYVIGKNGITLRGANIKGTCYAQSTIWLGVRSNNIQPNGYNVPALIMDRWGLGSATITIQTTGTTQNINGLVYSAGGGSGITISTCTANINGVLVADGTIFLDNATFLDYINPIFTGADPGEDIYSGFSGGRRAYVPTWQGWRLR